MEKLLVSTINGEYETNIYNVNDFPYYDLVLLPTCHKKNTTYYNVSSAFDIESTTLDGEKDSKGCYVKNPSAFMYQWQFCINKKVIFGRTWEEFQLLLKKLTTVLSLSKQQRLVIYVHNLSYEFQFMKEFIDIDSIFAREKRKVLKCLTTNGIEFRCSYFLSNMSLAKFCENTEGVTHYKLKDTYDYSKLRTPATPLTLEEKQYCYNDVYGLCECIDGLLKDDTIISIPLTNTGYVRREYRQAMKSNKKNWFKFQDTQLTEEQYRMLRRCFRGGNTHANRYVAGAKINEVGSEDIQSSYPATMLLDAEYPVGRFMEVKLNNQTKLDYYCRNYCVVLEVSFLNIICKKDVAIPYIDLAHCYNVNGVVNDNGRILKADGLSMTITNIDLDIIRRTYIYDGFVIHKAIYATKGKLPKELRKKLLEFYYQKTTLKGVEGKEYEYLKSKNRVNSTFGMCVTDIVNDTITYNSDTMEWGEEIQDINTALTDFYNNRNNFLSYQWGVFVTANARKRLQDMLDVVGLDVVYIDTDSIKFQNLEHVKEFEEKNKEIIKQCEENDIPAYVDFNGKRNYLGIWDNEGVYEQFKTLGAKKYCFNKKDKKGNIKFGITVAGMSKVKGAKAVGNIDNFCINRRFENVGRTTSWYNDVKPHHITVNGCTFLTASNIGILETSYTLGVTCEYLELIGVNLF